MYVRLAKAWTDRRGVRHPAGAYVNLDPATIAELEEDGTVEQRRPPSDSGGSDGFPEPGGRDGGGWGGPDGGGSAPGGRPPGTDFDDDR